MKYDLLLKNAEAMLPHSINELRIQKVDIAIHQQKIVKIQTRLTDEASQTIDCTNLTVLPGIIDSQVHFREPGLTHKEDLESGTRAAVLGGITSVFEMPNTSPSTTNEEQFMAKISALKGRAWCDVGFYLGASLDNSSTLANLENLPGCCGIKIFMGSSTGSLLVEDDDNLLKVLSNGKRRVAIHAEDEVRLKERRHIATEGAHARFHPEWRDIESALKATQRIVALGKKAKRALHILHISTAEEMEFLAAHKNNLSIEVLPQHLTFAAPEIYERLGNYAQQNPPIREARHREALWKAISQGVVDVIGSDHAPHTREEKDKAYPNSPSGVPGVQTLVPVMLNHIHNKKMSLPHFVKMTTENVAELFKLKNKGRIAVGYDADFTIVDLKRRQRIENSWIASKCAWTPYEGMEVMGWPIHTIVRGEIIVRDEKLVPKQIGQPLMFS